jgi:hypothetical protein
VFDKADLGHGPPMIPPIGPRRKPLGMGARLALAFRWEQNSYPGAVWDATGSTENSIIAEKKRVSTLAALVLVAMAFTRKRAGFSGMLQVIPKSK